MPQAKRLGPKFTLVISKEEQQSNDGIPPTSLPLNPALSKAGVGQLRTAHAGGIERIEALSWVQTA